MTEHRVTVQTRQEEAFYDLAADTMAWIMINPLITLSTMFVIAGIIYFQSRRG
jgi:hypothetical protein